MKKILSVLLILLMLTPVISACAGNIVPQSTQPAESAQVSSASGSAAADTSAPAPSLETPDPLPETPTAGTPTPETPTPETPTPETPTPGHKEGEPMTEEEMGVLPVGQYTVSAASGEKLSYAEGKYATDTNIPATFGGELNTFTIVFQTWKKNPYYLIFAGEDSMHVLASPYNDGWINGDNIKDGEELVFRGKKVISGKNTYYNDIYEAMQWQILPCEDGTYQIRSNRAGTELYLAVEDGRLIAASPERTGGIQSFDLKMTKRGGGSAFAQFISDDGDVTVRLCADYKKVTKLTKDEAQEWANQMAKAYHAYIELTDFVTHDNIVIKAYEPAYVPGYVYNTTQHYNVITLNESFMQGDLQKKKQRIKMGAEDWNFCALHEMGHMFDNQQSWYFEAEMMTDFKIPYVLQKYGVCASPSEYSVRTYFYADKDPEHKQIEECYVGLSTNKVGIAKSLTYSPYGGALKFVEIQRQVDDDNWTVIKQVYKELHAAGRPDYWNSSVAFRLFVDKIAEVSGKDIRAMFTDQEWNVYLMKVYDNKAVYFSGTDSEGNYVRKIHESMTMSAGAKNAVGAISNSAIVYSSSDPAVATVDETGMITALSRGNAVITIRSAEDGGEATLLLTVR